MILEGRHLSSYILLSPGGALIQDLAQYLFFSEDDMKNKAIIEQHNLTQEERKANNLFSFTPSDMPAFLVKDTDEHKQFIQDLKTNNIARIKANIRKK